MSSQSSSNRPLSEEFINDSDEETAKQVASKKSRTLNESEAATPKHSLDKTVFISGIPEVKPEKNSDGEIFFEIAPKRRITLRKWKGKDLIDIREFWSDAKGDEEQQLQPGKKGISLTVDQWRRILELAPSINKHLELTL